jgi:CDGSH-type Zn-finger protein
MGDKKIKVTKNGPYLVSGNLSLKKEIIELDDKGNSIGWKDGEKYPSQENYALCRCGKSKNPPYCDGTHTKVSFDGTETAGDKKHSEEAEKIIGPEIELLDVPKLCAFVRFCHNDKGNVWELTQDKRREKEATQQACNCSAGRLVMMDKKTGKAIEPKLEPSLGLIEDPKTGTSGPICLKGGVEVESAEGKKYETRNRVTLCRCGASGNKPFCDASHVRIQFNDGFSTP